ncbi:hypothetical protein [Kitasatospora viridis]|uniref:Uncharacterized protein n=1 Tax=Kitasatospora viridis TaxID=281105 RepID=A0A561UAL6_9ACTN|nr:hypothetical protein [Kitasatospora viridis]TWF96399.1 hypothetical protein FHX73_11164 [Kitasatospora viridis]
MAKLDMTPGPQIPRTEAGGPQTAVTQALSATAYRDDDLDGFIAKVQDGVVGKTGWHDLFRPNLGEAFSKAVIGRTLGKGRKPLVPAYGMEPRTVVEHCLAAEELRAARDKRLMLVTVVCGLLFLPGTVIWLGALELRRRLSGGKWDGFFGALILLIPAALTLFFAWKPPFNGLLSLYLRVTMLAPLVGWFLAKRIVVNSVKDLRSRWAGVLEGNLGAAVLPTAVPRHENDKKAAALKEGLTQLVLEQDTNVLHYAGVNGILGLGRRWGSWEMVEDLRPAEGFEEFRTFHTWDLVKKITDRLNGTLGRSHVANGAVPNSSVDQWVISSIGAGADEISRPGGPDMDGPRMRDHAVVTVANQQDFGKDGLRHYLGTQFVLNKGQLIVSVTVTVTALANTLRVSVAGHTLGPIQGAFTDKPKPKERTEPKPGKFWEERTIQLPLVDNIEVVRQALRAPFLKVPTLLAWLGGTMKLPEPFGLRHAWANPAWGNRFMADDSVRIASPVVSAVLAATIDFLADHDVNVDRFTGRSLIMKSEMQGARPFKSDQYDAW